MATAHQIARCSLGSVRNSRIIAKLAALALAGAAWTAPALADRPARVVSINLCTDQLALMLADPDQLVSVSHLAQNPDASTMAEAAQAFPTNGSGAEEVYLLKPDLVLAGTFNSPATLSILRNLGIEVAVFPPAYSMQDVRDILGGIGSALGQQDKTDAVLAKFDADLAGLSDAPLNGPRVALSYVNNYTSGDKTLAHEILTIAGFRNVASEVGISGPGKIPLEQLILLEPDIIITGRGYPGQSRAEDNLSHPALRALPDTLIAGELTDRDWACGTPYVLNAIAKMRELRLSMEAGQ